MNDSEAIGRIVTQELERVGELDRVDRDEDARLMLAMRRVAMRAFHEGAAALAALVAPSGVQVHVDAQLIDEEGVDLLLPTAADD
jgi:hypothetical protein